MPTRGQFIATVTENTPLCREHFRLTLAVANFPPTRAGQFVQIACRSVEDDGGEPAELDWPPRFEDVDLVAPTAVLRRPFSLAGRSDRDGVAQLQIIHRVVGIGTDWLSQLRVGEHVGLIGPLGNTFTPPKADQPAILVGGGVGIPPMLYLASELAGHKDVFAFCGATTRDLLPLTITGDFSADDPIVPQPVIAEFAGHGVKSVITTDDGSYGVRGFVTQALEQYLDANPALPPVIYTCGPEAMMKRVADIANRRNIECQVAVERAMACGMGTCQSCCIKVRKPDPAAVPLPGREWCYRLACTDGPVFKGADLLW